MPDLTVRKIGHSVTVMLDTDGTPLWMGERMVEVAPGEWMTPAMADFTGVTADAANHLGVSETPCQVSTHNLLLLNDGLHCPECRAEI